MYLRACDARHWFHGNKFVAFLPNFALFRWIHWRSLRTLEVLCKLVVVLQRSENSEAADGVRIGGDGHFDVPLSGRRAPRLRCRNPKQLLGREIQTREPLFGSVPMNPFAVREIRSFDASVVRHILPLRNDPVQLQVNRVGEYSLRALDRKYEYLPLIS